MPAPKDAPKTPPPQQDWTHTLARGVVSLAGFAVAGVLTLLLLVGLALAVAFPNLPDVTDLADYRPKLPLRVFTADGVLIDRKSVV